MNTTNTKREEYNHWLHFKYKIVFLEADLPICNTMKKQAKLIFTSNSSIPEYFQCNKNYFHLWPLNSRVFSCPGFSWGASGQYQGRRIHLMMMIMMIVKSNDDQKQVESRLSNLYKDTNYKFHCRSSNLNGAVSLPARIECETLSASKPSYLDIYNIIFSFILITIAIIITITL